MLDALDAAGLKATFFMVGEQVKAAPMLAREVAARGHEIALHGATHRPHRELGPRDSKDEPAYGLGTLEAATARRPRWFRPPYGVFNEHSYEAVRGGRARARLLVGVGDGLGDDLGRADPRHRRARSRPGAILVLHDSARYAYRPTSSATIEAIPLIAAVAAERGLALGPL